PHRAGGVLGPVLQHAGQHVHRAGVALHDARGRLGTSSHAGAHGVVRVGRLRAVVRHEADLGVAGSPVALLASGLWRLAALAVLLVGAGWVTSTFALAV